MFDVVIKEKRDRREVNTFDIIITMEKGQEPTIRFDEDTQAVIQAVLDEHGKFMLKFNWLDDDVVLIVPQGLTEETERVILQEQSRKLTE